MHINYYAYYFETCFFNLTHCEDFLLYSSKYFTVLACMFWSMIYSKLIFVYGVR